VVTLLEYVSPLAVLAIESLRKVAVQPLHTDGEIRRGGPQKDVVVSRHEAVGEARPVVTPYDHLEEAQEADAVIAVPEERLLADAAARHMVDAAG
jgi:hypothetical protein